jgi:hypothetical protein
VTSAPVKEALAALLTEARLGRRWRGLTGESRSAHARILHAFVASGRPPEISTFPGHVLADLERRDLVHAGDGRISVAYPFATEATDFLVTVEGLNNHAVCAIDALGVAAMTGKAARVSCLCPICGTAVETTVADDGLAHEGTTHPDARIWTGVMHVGACAADSQCKSMRLFCCAEHLAEWRESRPEMTGFDLSLAEGIQLGAAIFKPFLLEEAQGAAP